MQTLAAIFFGGTALIATTLIVLDPMPRLAAAMRGKTPQQFTDDAKAWSANKNPLLGLAVGCGSLLVVLASMGLNSMVFPLIAVIAITNEIGFIALGYAALGLAALNAWRTFAFFRAAETAMSTASVETPSENTTPVEILDRNGSVIATVRQPVTAHTPTLKIAHPAVLAARRAIYGGLPAVYLWYLFLVTIGVAP